LGAPGQTRRFCDNAKYQACNWLVPEGSSILCAAGRHNRTIPDLTLAANLPPWRRIEAAQHRVIYAFLRLRLPLANRTDNPEHGLAFDVLADPLVQGGPKVMTGHDNGILTIALAEADDAERKRRRTAMGEPYRTLLGHFRHESGHHYWDLLVRDGGKLEECRAIFGDNSQDYNEALQRQYANGAPADWQNAFVSAYATTHPWEDFAETWAHYLHILDTLEMASAFRMRVQPEVARTEDLDADIDLESLRCRWDRGADRGLAAADLCGEQFEPLHGRAGPLPLCAVAAGHREARLHSPAGTRTEISGMNSSAGACDPEALLRLAPN
jgi:hypothetical protein